MEKEQFKEIIKAPNYHEVPAHLSVCKRLL